MKNILLILFCVLPIFASSQEVKSELPAIDLKNLQGETINTSSISNDGPIFISFWATWCKPCVQELMAVDENLVDWQAETGVKVYAVSIDDAKTVNRVAPFVAGKAWTFEILLDTNSDFKRAMNVNNVPHSFVLDKTGKIIWQHNSYSPGDEDELYKVLKM